jgi:hypothetical protein
MTVIYFAGAEVERLTQALLDNGVRHILYSYYYILLQRREKFVEKMQDRYPDVSWFLDSGAFTFGVKSRCGDEHLPWRSFLRSYMNYLRQYGYRYQKIAELDLDWAELGVRYQTVDEWRDIFFDLQPRLPIMPVWNTGRGMESWERYLKDDRIKHLGVSGQVLSPGTLMRLLQGAHAVKKPVHGFAMTKMNTLRYAWFDSVDSSTWALGQRYGILYVWRGDKMIILNAAHKHQRKLYHRYFERIGCDARKIIKEDDKDEVRKCNIISWKLVSDRLQERSRQRKLCENDLPSESA